MRRGDRQLCAVAEQASGQGARITVEQDDICWKMPLVSLDPIDASVLPRDACRGGAVMQGCAACLRQLCDALRQFVHPACDGPNTLCLCLPDQREDCRRCIGRTANIGGVAAKELGKSRIAERPFEQTCEGQMWCHVWDQAVRALRCFVLEGGVYVRVGLLVDFGVWCFCL